MYGSCLGNRGKAPESPSLGGRKRDARPHTPRNDRGTLMSLDDHAAHWANLLGEIFREFPMHFCSWHNISEERKAEVLGKIEKGIEQHLAKIYTDNKSSLKAEHWVANPEDGTYGVEGIRSRYPANISVADWDAQIAFWSNPNVARCAQNARNRPKSTVICRQGSRSLAVLRDRQMESSATQEYPSLIQTYFDTNTVNGVFLRNEEQLLYEEMLRLQGLGTYTNDQIMAIVRRGKQRGHILGVSRVLAGRGRDILVSPKPRCTHTVDVDELKRTNKQLNKQMDMIMKCRGGDDEPGDDELGDDEDADEEEDDEDEDS
ncbi:hypothetical protein Tco_0620734 [Tanacetum coccineum]